MSLRARSAVLALLLAAAAAGARADEITVSAAASLGNAFNALAPLFAAAHPGDRIRLNLAASGTLLQQLAQGAPVDVLATADAVTMDQAESKGLVAAGARHDFATNALVVVVPKAAPAAPRPARLEDLKQPAFARIAVGLPASVPAGRYARAALEQAGLWNVLSPRFITAQSVRQALDYAARGEVDAAFVYATDAATMPDKVRVAFTVPTPTRVRYPIATVAGSAHADAARRFVAFVASPAAQAVLTAHGFGPP